MGILILGVISTVGEVFLIYFLAQLILDARKESQQLRLGAEKNSHAAKFNRFEITPPRAKAIWREGKWVRIESGGAMEPGRENYWKSAHRA